jgi:hypothetical protein
MRPGRAIAIRLLTGVVSADRCSDLDDGWASKTLQAAKSALEFAFK